jgi:hypothetical protein
MAFSYLEPDNLVDAWHDSGKFMRPLFEPFGEFERIARNRPHPGIDKAYPKVTDGTTASVIAKTPRRIVQQLPSGLVHSAQNDWLTKVAGFILTDRIIPNANSQYAFIQKVWNTISKALTYGSQPAYVPFIQRGDYLGTDLIVPYIKDVFLEPGKLSDEDSNYILMRGWYQPRDIKAIIYNQGKLKASAEARGEEYLGGWDLKALAEIEDQISQKDDLSTTPNERDKNNRSGGVEIIHAYQRGMQGKFYSFHAKTKQVVRTRTNKDPRGVIPIHYMYADTDGSNPLGRGFIELVGAMQNLMDAEVQMYQYNRALMLNPPMLKRGNWNDNDAKLAPNVLVDLGSEPNATWEPVKIDSTAIANFPNNYGLMQSQIYQLLSAPNANISAQTGTQAFSKTQAGVQQQTANLNVDDNFIRKQTETWLEKVFETQVNLYFAERKGTEELQLDADTANEVKELDPNLVSEDRKVRINYDSPTEVMTFRVDPGSSEQKDDQQDIAELKEILSDVNQNPYSIQYIQQAGKDLNLGEVYKQLFMKLNLKDIDKILTDAPKGPDGQAQSTPPMAIDKPKLVINFSDINSPTVKAALLQNAGIQADPNDIAQSDAVKAQQDNPPKDTADPQEHPIIKLMTSLNIKFESLPQDSQEEVLAIIGIPTNQLTPTSAKTALQAIDQQHQISSANEQQQNAEAQMAQTDQQNQAQNTLAANAQAQQSVQNQAQNSLQASAQANQQGAPNASTATRRTNSTSNTASITKAVSSPQAQNPSDSLTAKDHEYIAQLQKLGVPDQTIGQALALIHHGYPLEDVLKMISTQLGVQ